MGALKYSTQMRRDSILSQAFACAVSSHKKVLSPKPTCPSRFTPNTVLSSGSVFYLAMFQVYIPLWAGPTLSSHITLSIPQRKSFSHTRLVEALGQELFRGGVIRMKASQPTELGFRSTF